MCFYSAHLCVFFFFTPLDQLSPRVWHLWLYPSASQCRLAEQHLITGRIWLTGALIMVVGKAQSLPFQQYTLCRKRSTVSQSDKKKKKSQILPIIISSLLYLSTFFSKLSYCGWHQSLGSEGWWDTIPERDREEKKVQFRMILPWPLCLPTLPRVFFQLTPCARPWAGQLRLRSVEVLGWQNIVQLVALLISHWKRKSWRIYGKLETQMNEEVAWCLIISSTQSPSWEEEEGLWMSSSC